MTETEKLDEWLKTKGSCEKLLSPLSTGKAYTLIEIADFSGLTRERTRMTVKDLVAKGLLKTRINRQRDYYFIGDQEVLMYIRSRIPVSGAKKKPEGMKYARHCYNHLAGYVGVNLTAAMVRSGYLIPDDSVYTYQVTEKGWDWFSKLGIQIEELRNTAIPAKQCLDFSERKSHLGGKLGDALLQKFLEKKWFIQVADSREIKFTSTGKNELNQLSDFLY